MIITGVSPHASSSNCFAALAGAGHGCICVYVLFADWPDNDIDDDLSDNSSDSIDHDSVCEYVYEDAELPADCATEQKYWERIGNEYLDTEDNSRYRVVGICTCNGGEQYFYKFCLASVENPSSDDFEYIACSEYVHAIPVSPVT